MASSPLIVIVGQTASGKSALAMELAEGFNGEIICADARTVYKGMDIGTAKPSAIDQARVPHHLLDMVEPGESFTAADFKRLAQAAIEDISARGKLPILVGGTGLYIDAVLYDFQFRAPADPKVRSELEKLSVEQLQERLSSLGLALPNNERNPRHLIRAIEANGQPSERRPLRDNTLVIGLTFDQEVLGERIRARLGVMLEAGFIEEVRGLQERYDTSAAAFDTPGYRPFLDYLDGEISFDEARERFAKNDMNLAKRQKTWFKRNKSIQWVSSPRVGVEIATTFLNKTAS